MIISSAGGEENSQVLIMAAPLGNVFVCFCRIARKTLGEKAVLIRMEERKFGGAGNGCFIRSCPLYLSVENLRKLCREKVVHIIMEKRIMYLVSGFPKKLTPLKDDYTPMKG